MSTAVTLKAVPPVPVATPDQKAKIRSLLDRYFDDATGVYLDDQSDTKLAETLRIPEILVRTIRETAYGPLCPAPDIPTMKKEAADLKAELDRLKEQMQLLYSRQTAFVQQLHRIETKATTTRPAGR